QVRGDVLVAQAEPGGLGAVGGQLLLDRPGLPDPPPATLRIGAAAERIHDAVEVGADPQPVQRHVVADVDHRRHVRPQLKAYRAHAEQEARAADPAGKNHDPHGSNPAARVLQPFAVFLAYTAIATGIS